LRERKKPGKKGGLQCKRENPKAPVKPGDPKKLFPKRGFPESSEKKWRTKKRFGLKGRQK